MNLLAKGFSFRDEKMNKCTKLGIFHSNKMRQLGEKILNLVTLWIMKGEVIA